MSENKRPEFIAKALLVGGCAVAGIACMWGGVSAFSTERGLDAALYLALGLGVGTLLLRGAWKAAGD